MNAEGPTSGASGPAVRVAQYLRMSTEHQRYSTEHQALAIGHYAAARGYQIVRTYADRGISGVSIRGRDGLKRLLADVIGGAADYALILVHDVSRWGRFQNPDQAAHYEFLCAEAGVRIEYCAEAFENDGSPSATILKALKRVMAAEFSRDLSVKVAAAQLRFAKQGFWQGGPPGFGLRRQMVAPDGARGRVLAQGEYKAIQDHHTILVPGPPTEIATIKRIYRLFVEGGQTRASIVRILNAEQIPAEAGAAWTRERLTRILTGRKYAGDLEANKTSGGLGRARRRNPKAEWVSAPGAIAPIVSRAQFAAAQRAIAARRVLRSTEALIAILRDVQRDHGEITTARLRARPDCPSASIFVARFGSLEAAREAIDAPSRLAPRPRVYLRDDEALRRLAQLFGHHGYLDRRLIDMTPDMPCAETYARRFGTIANAYAMVGFVPLSRAARLSQVGRARANAAQARRKPG